jgi:putative transposase
VAEASGIEVLHTAYRAPKENAVCERFLGSVRRACLDHLLVLGEAHLRRLLYFNAARPHQGWQQQIPDRAEVCLLRPETGGTVRAVPALGGLHHTYRRVA